MEKVRYANIEKFREELATRKAEFDKQLKEVQKQYPLVAIAYGLQAAVIAEQTSSCALAYVGIAGPLYTSLTLDKETAKGKKPTGMGRFRQMLRESYNRLRSFRLRKRLNIIYSLLTQMAQIRPCIDRSTI